MCFSSWLEPFPEPAVEDQHGSNHLLILVYALLDWVILGIAEGHVVRTYRQNKLIALCGGGRGRSRKPLAIVSAPVL